tara:strand:+ start:757 stop:1401 length:645 start_codon:yes stop_codon:yes gene_type:complete
MKLRTTENEKRQIESQKIAKEVLSGDYTVLNISEPFSIKEKIKENKTEVSCKIELKNSDGSSIINVKATGNGPIDALFTNLKKKLSKEYCSLNLIRFSEFGVSADIQKRPNYLLNSSGSNAEVEVILIVQNDRGEDLIFRDHSTSINKAAVNVVLKTVEYFINSEKAVLLLHKNIVGADDRNRGDLTIGYTCQLAELVKNVSYKKTIMRNKNKK